MAITRRPEASDDPLVVETVRSDGERTYRFRYGPGRDPAITVVMEGLHQEDFLRFGDLRQEFARAILGERLFDSILSVQQVAHAVAVADRASRSRQRITLDFLADVVEAGKHKTARQLAAEYGVDERTVRRWLARAQEEGLR
jgi:hypothetical protein